MRKDDTKLITGFGSALVDILSHEKDLFLEQTGAVKGAMILVDKQFIDKTLSMMTGKPVIVPGGSACNTVLGIAKLGGKSRFVGKLGTDDFGHRFRTELQKSNVNQVLFTSTSPTGRVLSIITPDAQRSMFTYLGASSETRPEEITPDCFENSAIVHIEGYMLFNTELMFAALRSSKEAGALISLDLASFTVVEESRELLKTIADDFVDILIANEDRPSHTPGFRMKWRLSRHYLKM